MDISAEQNLADSVIADAIDYLVAHYRDQPSLDALAARAGYDKTHFQKVFRQKAGISPKRFTQFMTYRHARDLLASGHDALDAAFDAGLSGTGRLHDLFVACEAATPGEVRKRGQGVEIRYGFHPTPLGELLVGRTPRGVCWLGFRVDGLRDAPMARMHAHWPEAVFIEDIHTTAPDAAKIVAIWMGAGDARDKLLLDLHGTNFQIQVWRALLKIPNGQTVTYDDVAGTIGRPKSQRAVGNAVGANPVSLLIPCHRVIRKSGVLNNYGWGDARKKALLGMEAALHGEAAAGDFVLGSELI